MKQFVLDCSVAMAWCFKEEKNRYVLSVLDSFAKWEAIVPPIWSLEVLNVLLVAEQRDQLTQADTAQFNHLLSSLPIYEEACHMDQNRQTLLHLGRTHTLSSYDACYLELAMHKALPLATQDDKLALACTACGVEIFMKIDA